MPASPEGNPRSAAKPAPQRLLFRGKRGEKGGEKTTQTQLSGKGPAEEQPEPRHTQQGAFGLNCFGAFLLSSSSSELTQTFRGGSAAVPARGEPRGPPEHPEGAPNPPRGPPQTPPGPTYDLGAAVPAGVLEAGLPLLVGPVPEAGVFNLRGTGRSIRGVR